MVRSYRRDLLIDSRPDTIRTAYRAAEHILKVAENVVVMITGKRADLLPQAMGRLLTWMPEVEAAVLASEPQLAPARRSGLFVAMGEKYTTAHLAALAYGKKIALAVGWAAQPCDAYRVDAWAEKGESGWSEAAKKYLVEHGIVTTERGPGPRWREFRRGFHKLMHQLMPDDQPEDLQAAMRREVAEWAHRQRSDRLTIDWESNSLTLDGVVHGGLDPTGLRIIAALQEALWSGNPVVSGPKLSELVPGCRGGEKAVRRKLEKLPEAIQSLVEAERGTGYWLQLPPR
jgi:hypothetical protein